MPYGKKEVVVYGLDFVTLKPEDRPPYIFMGIRRLTEQRPCLAFYVDRDLKGPYWPDEDGRMVRNRRYEIDFEGMSKEAARLMLKGMIERKE